MNAIESSKLICEQCGTEMLIPRNRGQRRERGHVKHMYCYQCKETTAFIEGISKDSSVSFWESWQEQGVGQDE